MLMPFPDGRPVGNRRDPEQTSLYTEIHQDGRNLAERPERGIHGTGKSCRTRRQDHGRRQGRCCDTDNSHYYYRCGRRDMAGDLTGYRMSLGVAALVKLPRIAICPWTRLILKG